MLDIEAARSLPQIPLHPNAGGTIDIARAHGARLADLMAAARRHYTGPVLKAGDHLSRRWLRRTANPYGEEIAAVAAIAGAPGAVMLNLSFEWACTTSLAPDPGGPGMRLLRTLDWPLDGLGRNLVAAERRGRAGRYLDVTWPGFAGVLTGLAPGRFAAAINQAPMHSRTAFLVTDWALARVHAWRQCALPPAHLLRRVFDECATYGEAKRLLCETPLCLPVLFSLAGIEAGEGCVIERLEGAAAVHAAPSDAPIGAANHWLDFDGGGRAKDRERGEDSHGRLALMRALAPQAGDDFAWLKPPILNPTTRLAVSANARTGALRVQGWESGGPASRVLRVEARA